MEKRDGLAEMETPVRDKNYRPLPGLRMQVPVRATCTCHLHVPPGMVRDAGQDGGRARRKVMHAHPKSNVPRARDRAAIK